MTVYRLGCVCVCSPGLIEQRDSQPLLKLIESIGDWPAASEDWNTTTGTNACTSHCSRVHVQHTTQEYESS